MLDHTDFNYISIDAYNWERLTVFMLADAVYITHILNWVKVKVIANFNIRFPQGKHHLTKK